MSKQRIALREAEALAVEVAEILRPACTRLEIAGSIRRQRPDVGDIEVVAIAKVEHYQDLFGQPSDEFPFNHLDALCAELRETGVLGERLDKNGRRAWGSAMKRATFKGFALDLFACLDPAQWGVTFAIRTGGAVFSHALVTSKVQMVRDESGRAFGPGLCPSWLEFRGWRVRHVSAGSAPYLTPEESDVFDILRLDFIPPQERDAFMEARAAAGARR
jgi:DNA polymerase/3'-5' exonuclease PolX